MKKFVFMGLLAVGISVFLSACKTSNPDGVKSETYTKKTSKTQKLIIE
ncbi:MAG: hypothetical protein KOO69_03305 [Victivallales bacterium]|nr:hypothetical protein [Victivallales bacterium]